MVQFCALPDFCHAKSTQVSPNHHSISPMCCDIVKEGEKWITPIAGAEERGRYG